MYGQTRLAWKRFWESESIRERDRYLRTGWHDRVAAGERIDYRNGFFERDFVTRLERSGYGLHAPEARTSFQPGWRSFSGGPKMWRS